MKRVIVLVLAMLLVSATVATVAYAVDKVCQPQKRCVGTNSLDILSGSKGNGTIIALGGHDSLDGCCAIV